MLSLSRSESGENKTMRLEKVWLKHIYRQKYFHLKCKMFSYIVQFWLKYCTDYVVFQQMGFLINYHQVIISLLIDF